MPSASSCAINVTFTAASGHRDGSLTLTDNASDSPQTVALTGSGGLPATLMGLHLNHNSVGSEHLPDDAHFPMPAVPFGSLRMWGSNENYPNSPGTRWHLVETANGTFNWTVVDHYLQELQTLGVTDMSFVFGEITPNWALNANEGNTCTGGSGGRGCHPPQDIAEASRVDARTQTASGTATASTREPMRRGGDGLRTQSSTS